jgi:hypothetical protein
MKASNSVPRSFMGPPQKKITVPRHARVLASGIQNAALVVNWIPADNRANDIVPPRLQHHLTAPSLTPAVRELC